jgi:hypothetical protein
MFDEVPRTGTPPRSARTERCGEISRTIPNSWPLQRQPVCNRPHWHTGPHQEIRRHDFAVLHEWETSR